MNDKYKNIKQEMDISPEADGICGGPEACEGKEYEKGNKECEDCVADVQDAMAGFSTMDDAHVQGKLFEMYKMSDAVFHEVRKDLRPLALEIGNAITKLGEALDSSKNSISAEEPK